MKKKITLFAVLFITLSSYVYISPRDYLRNDFNQYIHLIMNKNFDSCTYYMPEKIFDIVPKAQLVTMMEKTMNDPTITYEMFEPTITEISEIEEIENNHYAILKYSMKMNIRYNWKKMPDYDENETHDSETILLSLKATFGKENVKYNNETKFYNIVSFKKVAGISANGRMHWKFAVLDPQQAALAKMILPTKIIEKSLD